MAIKADYSAGVATLAAGGTTVTFSGGANITAADIQPGDTFKVQNLDAIIATVTDATHVELNTPWTGTTLTAAPYRIRYQPDGSRYTAALRDLVTAIGGGSLAALQAVTGAANKIPYYTSATTMALADFKAWALSFLSLTPAANKSVYFTDANTAALFDLTAAGRGLVGATSALAQLAVLGLPEQLAANRTYYVRKDGNDANTGLTDNNTGAFLTINAAINAAYSKQDLRNFTAFIVVRTGTYVENLSFSGRPAWAGKSGQKFPIYLTGDTGTPANVVIAPSSGKCITANGGAGVDLHGFRTVTTGSDGYHIFAEDSGTNVNFGNWSFGASTADHIFSQLGSVVTFDTGYAINGGALNHYHATEGGSIKFTAASGTITLTGTPAFTGQFAGCAKSMIALVNLLFSGAATGRRFLTHLNGSIRTGTDDPNFLPGSVPGYEDGGGRFDYGPRFSAHRGFTDYTITPGAWNFIPLPSVAYNVGGAYDATNSRFVPRAGVVSMRAAVVFTAGLVDGWLMGISIFKNGVEFKTSLNVVNGTGGQGMQISIEDVANGFDYYQVYARADSGGNKTVSGSSAWTWFIGHQH